MKLEIYNDLHLEFGPPLPAFRGGEVLSIAGDMVSWRTRQLGVDVLNSAAKQYEQVFFVLGNHEFYGAPDYDAVKRFWYFEAEFAKNVTVLRTNILQEYGGLVFGGDTLWTDLTDLQQVRMRDIMNDCKQCLGLTGSRVATDNMLAWAFFRAEKPDVMITHHLPTEAVIAPQWRGKPYNEYFANRYGKAEQIGAKLWHFGHTHETIDMVHEGTHYVCNPYGYHKYQENPEFKPFLEIEL